MTTISVFGGTGFFGRRLVQRLVAEGARVRVAVRHSERARSILDAADLDRVTILRADVRDQAAVAAAVAGADAVVNAVSAYVEKGGVTFEAIHEKGAEMIAREAAAAGVGRLVLLSGIGADPESRSPYIRARGRGELVVQQAFPGATIVRPGAMFGPGDALFGTLAALVPLLPVLPLIGGGRSRLQPVYVDDVADAVTRVLADSGTAGRTYELAGPQIYTLLELIRFALRLMGRRRPLLPIPFAVAEIQARLFEFLPSPPLTTSQVDLLKADNVASGALPGFRDLDIQPRTVEEVVPTYVGVARK
ncbi:MAG TPA: complex I NDUFA9 subunit family protein [Candidatus Angelobacter sp.]|nr:complex I NDUFA9 subunit family protein [Candidatus Angelobacter sp.]